MKRTSLILIAVLAITFVMAFANVVNATNLPATDIGFTKSADETRDFTPTEFTAAQLVVGKQAEFDDQINDLKTQDRAEYDTQKAAFEAEEDAKFAADPTYVVQEYPEYVNPVVENYGGLFSTDATNYTYAEILSTSSNTSFMVIDGQLVPKTTITVNYKLVTVNVVGGGEQISSVNLTIQAPPAGTSMTAVPVHTEWGDYTTYEPLPVITLENGANYDMAGTYYISAFPSQNPSGYDEPFTGTFVDGQEYYVEVYLTPKAGYTFAPTVTLTANGVTSYEVSEWNFENQFMFYAKVKASSNAGQQPDQQPNVDPRVLNGGNQTINPSVGEKLSFRFDMNYATFLANGKVLVDGKEVDSSNYTSAEGSTIITFNDGFTKALAVGGHEIALNAGSEVITTNFTIASTPGQAGGAGAAQVVGSVSGSTSNPKTGDNIVLFVAIFIVATVGSVIAIKKYRK